MTERNDTSDVLWGVAEIARYLNSEREGGTLGRSSKGAIRSSASAK